MDSTGISRRALLSRGLAASGLALAGGLPLSWSRAAARSGAPDLSLLASSRRLRRWVEEMVELGPRFTGGRAHRQFVDMLEEEFRAAGLRVERDRYRFDRWLARGHSLELLEGPDRGPVRVAYYYPYSGRTPRDGVTGELVYAGPMPSTGFSGNPLDVLSAEAGIERLRRQTAGAVSALIQGVPGGVRGKIVLMDVPLAPIPTGIFLPFLTYLHDWGLASVATSDYKRVWINPLTLVPLELFKRAGAVGAVFALDASRRNAAGQYTPFGLSLQDLPALLVDRATGDRLRRAASVRPRARLVLRASVERNAPTDSLVALLPGDGSTDETMIVNTHTDGQNAFEENGAVACVALARYFSRLPRSARRRTLVFSCVTGHFGPGLPQTEGFIEDHPDLVERAAAALTVEHFGAREWLDDARSYYATGRIEPAAIFHSQTPIAAVGIESMQAADLERTALLRPIGAVFFGIGAPLHLAGVPSLAFITGPNYLLSVTGDGHLDKFDARRMRTEVSWVAEALHRLDRVPAETLRAGDTAIFRGPS